MSLRSGNQSAQEHLAMSDCQTCPIEPICHYPYKPCECVQQRKFWDEYRRQEWERQRNTSTVGDERG